MSDDPVARIRAQQPYHDAFLAHVKAHSDYDHERETLTFEQRGIPADGPFERMVTFTMSAKYAHRILGYISPWAENDDWTADAYQEMRAALEEHRD